MKKSALLILIGAAALTVGLYSLPKVVVQNENKRLTTTSETRSTQIPGRATGPAGKSQNGVTSGGSKATDHAASLTPVQQRQLDGLHRQLAVAAATERPAVAEQLLAFFRSVSKFDSAAHYAEMIAQANPSERNLLRAGDTYYEAFGFAIDEQKSAYLGQKTRDLYASVLAKDPSLLGAKANMAMTYVNTQTPMQGIMLLREVLQEDPTNELALFNLGLLSMRSGQFTKAIERFRQILVNNPTSRKAQFYLGVSLVQAGQKAEARKVLASVKAVEKDPQIQAAIRELEGELNE